MESLTTTESTKPHRTRRAFSMTEKLAIVNMLAGGHSATKIARIYNVNESTIRNIRKQEPAIREAALMMTPKVAAGSKRNRNQHLPKMEACLITWLDDLRAKRLPVWYTRVRSKALQFYEAVGGQPRHEIHGGFTASNGWFERFKRKYDLQELRPHDDRAPPSETEFKNTLKSTIMSQYLTFDQIFMAESTTFRWKQMPGLKAKEKAMMIFCCNASGDFVTQPLVFAPQTGKISSSNSIFLRITRSESVTEQDVRDWINDHFLPETKAYLQMKKQSGQTLLIFASDKNHPKHIEHHSIDVSTIPADCNSSCLPAARGILNHLHAVYLEQVCQKLLHDVSSGLTVQDAWERYSITDALEILGISIHLLDKSVLSNSWSYLLETTAVQHSNNAILNRIVSALHTLGIADVTVDMVRNQITPRELFNEEVLELVNKHQEEAACRPIPGYNVQHIVEQWPPQEELDYQARLTLADEIDQHQLALVKLQEFCDQQDRNRTRAAAITRRLKQVNVLMKEMRDELRLENGLDPIAIEVKSEPRAIDSD